MKNSGPASMANRLVVGFGSLFVLLTIASGCVLYGVMQSRLQHERGQILKDRFDAVTSLLNSPAHGLEDLRERVTQEWPTRGGEKVFVRVLDGEAKLVTQTPGADPAVLKNLSVRETDNQLGLPKPIQISIGVDDGQSAEFLASLRETLVLVSLFNLALSLFAGWWIVRRELRPLEMIATTIGGINSKNLHERIELDRLPREVAILPKAFNRSLDRLEDSFDRLSRFSSDIAHELRTPIANIMGTFEVVLSRTRTPEGYVEAIESGLEEASRLRKITESLLFLARSEDTGRQIQKMELDLKTELSGVLDFLEASASDRGISMIVNSDSDFAVCIQAEAVLFQRVLVNILENAIRYTQDGGQIQVSCMRARNRIKLSVKDNGRGIPAESLPFVFERFYRVDPSRSSHSGGVGLGLAIVKSIVQLHGGEIQIRSELGKGTEVEIDWPTNEA